MKKISVFLFSALVSFGANAENIISLPLCDGDATKAIQQAIDKAASYKGKPVTIRLENGNYDLSRGNGLGGGIHSLRKGRGTCSQDNIEPQEDI